MRSLPAIAATLVLVHIGARAEAGESEESSFGTSIVPLGGVPAATARAARESKPSEAVVTGAWTILADSKIQSVDIQDSSSSFGVGVMHQGKFEETSLVIRKGTADSLTDRTGSRVFGAFVLAPETAKLGASARHWWLWNDGLACRAPRDVVAHKRACDVPHDVVSVWRYGLYASVDVGMTNVSSAAAGLDGASLVAGAGTVALALRREDDITLGGVARPVALGLWLGPTLRVLGGDLSGNERSRLLANSAPAYVGVELGGLVRLANFNLSAKISWIGGDNRYSVAGLSRLQFTPSVQFILPFDILETTPPAGSGPKPSVAAPATGPTPVPSAGAAPAAPGTPDTTPPPSGSTPAAPAAAKPPSGSSS